ncbi:Translocation protein S66 [Microbotryomycetes sp. JL221]|nr:Translocation protein S66 [Microbotryomycetes sp. JL221]
MVSVLVPLSYLVFLFGSLAVFSRFYRKRQHDSSKVVESWFPKHKSRDLYISLLSMEPPPARPVLIAALLRRAMDDVRMIWDVRDSKQALQTMLQKGQVGDELWERFTRAEKELEAEIVEVVGEANTFQEGYGQQLFGLASEMVTHERIKQTYNKIAARRQEEAARMKAPLPTMALAPHAYLTPTTLSLALSNPLADLDRALEANEKEDQASQQTTNAQAPLPSDATTSVPPSKDELEPSTASQTPAKQTKTDVATANGDANVKPTLDGPSAPPHPSVAQSPVAGAKVGGNTSGGSAKKPVNKRKKVKGGR